MATAKKKTKRNYKKRPEPKSPFPREIALVVIILFCILSELSFFGLCGVTGVYISNFFFGVFGFLAYIFPILFLVGSGLWLSNPTNRMVKKKVAYAACTYICLLTLFQWGLNDPIRTMSKYYHVSMLRHMGGGAIGGSICGGLQSALGRVGSLLVILALTIIFLILFTGKLIFTALSEVFRQEAEEPKRVEKREEPVVKQREPKSRKMAGFTSYQFPKKSKERKERKNKGEKPDKENMPGVTEPVKDTKAEPEAAGTSEAKMESGIPPIAIIRSGEEVPIYQEELENKFGKGQANQGTTQVEQTDNASKSSVKKANATSPKAPQVKPVEPAVTTAKPSSVAYTQTKLAYQFPSLDLLNMPERKASGMSDKQLFETANKLQSTLDSFGVKVRMGDVSCGPSVTRYELVPEQGVKVSRITGLSDDIKLSLAASDIRIEAPIPGKAAVGIEVPNTSKTMVTLRELLDSKEFSNAKSKVSFAVGKDIAGKTVVTDVAKMPHLLVAGATGSGKSVCINTLIMSILYKAHPDEVKMILIDPKQVEFGVYNDIPHLMIPVVTDPKKASAALNWAVAEMTGRYNKFAELGVRNIEGYNKRIDKMTVADDNFKKMPQVVIIVDEFADLMMVAPGEVEDAVCRLAQLARAAGIHLVLATQRPSVNVITGLIKANIPSRIALSVSSAIDSRTIIDGSGAEKLLGNGDMLFAPGDFPKPVRIQGAYVSEKEVFKVVDFLKAQFDTPTYDNSVTEQIEASPSQGSNGGTAVSQGNDRDELFVEAAKFIIEKDKASIGMLQRVFRIGFNRAARIMDQLSDAGVVGPEEGTKPRVVLMSIEQFENYLEENG